LSDLMNESSIFAADAYQIIVEAKTEMLWFE
jgi:hypothetical protein